MKTLLELANMHNDAAVYGMQALTNAGITKPEQITTAGLDRALGFGHSSALYLAYVLAQEVARLNRLIDHINNTIEANK